MKHAFAWMSCLFVSALSAECYSGCEKKCPPPCCEVNCNVPIASPCCPRTYSCCGVTFDLYGELLVLQPLGSNLYYAVEAIPFDPNIAVPAASPNWKVFEITPNYTPGFQVGARFLFPNYDMNLELNWERLYSVKKESHTAALANDMIGPIFDIGPNSAAYQSAHGYGTFRFDSAKLMFGKRLCFINCLNINFYTSATFTRIKQNVITHYRNISGTIARRISAPSTFTGAGPEFGLHFDYLLGCNFYFTGDTSASLLMGQLKNKTTYSSESPTLYALQNPSPNVQTTTVPHRSQLVPGFEDRLGFSWAYELDSCKFTVATGYQFQIYLNAIQSFDMVSQVLPNLAPVTPDIGLFAVAFQRTLSNFILTGPYFSLFIDF